MRARWASSRAAFSHASAAWAASCSKRSSSAGDGNGTVRRPRTLSLAVPVSPERPSPDGPPSSRNPVSRLIATSGTTARNPAPVNRATSSLPTYSATPGLSSNTSGVSFTRNHRTSRPSSGPGERQLRRL